jgi:6-phosphogluconolactonase
LSSNIEVLALETHQWDQQCANLILKEIDSVLSHNSECNIALTGGVTATYVYREMNPYFNKDTYIQRVNIYFSDERCVPIGFNQTNYELVVQNLFGGKAPNNLKIYPIDGAAIDIAAEAQRCNDLLQSDIDILLLSLGVDGHIASLFKLSPSIKKNDSNFVPIVRSIPFISRISITPHLISKAKKVIVFAKGFEKVAQLKKLISGVQEDEPISLLSNATWVINKSTENFLYEK